LVGFSTPILEGIGSKNGPYWKRKGFADFLSKNEWTIQISKKNYFSPKKIDYHCQHFSNDIFSSLSQLEKTTDHTDAT